MKAFKGHMRQVSEIALNMVMVPSDVLYKCIQHVSEKEAGCSKGQGHQARLPGKPRSGMFAAHVHLVVESGARSSGEREGHAKLPTLFISCYIIVTPLITSTASTWKHKKQGFSAVIC